MQWLDAGEKRIGHALRASLFPVGDGVRRLNPFMAKRFGPPGNAWARQIRLSRSRSFKLGTRHAHRARKDRPEKERHCDAASHACVQLCDACPSTPSSESRRENTGAFGGEATGAPAFMPLTFDAPLFRSGLGAGEVRGAVDWARARSGATSWPAEPTTKKSSATANAVNALRVDILTSFHTCRD
jgi:hypothetical protein